MRDLSLETASIRDLRAAIAASGASIAWTAAASTAAVTAGVTAGSLVLVAFGAVGGFDLVGSVALLTHFRHALRHQAISDNRERVAQLIVSVGMAAVGTATLAASVVRLASRHTTSEPTVGVAVSAASVLVLGYLGTRKRAIGARIPSDALITDGWLSLTGCATAACALVGLALNQAFGWSWVDPVAAMTIAAIAITIGAVSLRRVATPRGKPPRRGR